MLYTLLSSEVGSIVPEQTNADASLVMQYIIYGGIFIVGLIILCIMGKANKKPIHTLAVQKTEAVIKRIDKFLAGKEKTAKYALPTKIMQFDSEIGDLIVLADKEYTTNRNIAFEGVLSCYQTASKRLAGGVAWEMSSAEETLLTVKADLNQALDILKQLSKK